MNMPRTGRRARRHFATAAALALAASGALSACDGDNLWRRGDVTGPAPGQGGSGGDANPPTVAFVSPKQTDQLRIAVGDSVLVRVKVTDKEALGSLELAGFALRGSADLGTQQKVERFGTKSVAFDSVGGAVRDTTITRYLIATADTVSESPVYLVATVRDTAGTVRADTVTISIGGPQVRIASPADGTEVRAGVPLRIELSARERQDRIATIRLWSEGGGINADTTLRLSSLVASVDTAVTVVLPPTAQGTATLRAEVTTARGDHAAASPVALRILAPSGDAVPPTVRFSVSPPQRVEVGDSFSVTVTAADDVLLKNLGLSVLLLRRSGGVSDTLRATHYEATGVATRTFRFSLADLGQVEPRDTATLSLELTAFARDTANNCATATVPDTQQSGSCRAGTSGTTLGELPGGRFDVLLVRGQTVRLSASGTQLADLASDGTRVFVSNLGRNRVEVLPVGAREFGAPIAVGSEPWGLAISRDGSELLVANSGGTNISAISLASGTLRETRRIRTADVRLYDVAFDIKADTVTSVVMVDYSDRPQFLAQTSAGHILYSTKPTGARSDGTVRIVDPAKDQTYEFNRGSEIFAGYATRTEGKAILVNALDAAKVPGGQLAVCPRRVTAAQADPACVVDFPSQVSVALTALRAAGQTDTRLDLNRDLGSIGLTDTTFIAVSGDRSTVAFGEGAISPGRILHFRVQGSSLLGSGVQTQDLVGNAAERVIGLGLNADGSLGAARGNQVYFFDPTLRLEGIVQTGQPSGGVTLDPAHSTYPSTPTELRQAFVSGEENGLPFIDVVDTYTFQSLRRIFLRSPVTGSVKAVATGNASGLMFRVYAITEAGVLYLDIYDRDLAR
jgi:hypothetical protein